nr:hypothetical protein [Tanacetum cinerariifolium]
MFMFFGSRLLCLPQDVHETIIEEVMKEPEITLLGNVPFGELYGHDEESPFDTELEIKFTRKEYPIKKLMLIRSSLQRLRISLQMLLLILLSLVLHSFDQEMAEVDSDLESMPDDEIESVSGFEEADDDDSENAEELSVADEAVVDDVIDELVDMAKSQDANLNVSAAKATNSDPLGHLQVDITSLAAKVNNLEPSLPHKVANKIDDSVPRMVDDVFKERLPELLSNTLENILPELLKDNIEKAMPKFDKRVKKTLRAEV